MTTSSARIENDSPQSDQPVGFYRRLAGLAVVMSIVAWLGYGVLPTLGFDNFAEWFSAPHLIGLSALMAGGLFYIGYMRACLRWPERFLLGYMAALPWFTWISRQLMEVGVNFPQTLSLGALFLLPALLHVRHHWKTLVGRYPLLPCYLIFWLLTVLYFLFFDHPVYDHTAAVGKQTISVHYLITMTMNLAALLTATKVAVWTHSPTRLLETLRRVVIGMVLALSVFALICYPLQLYLVSVEGVLRMTLIFSHPNQFAMYQVFLLTALIGFYFYDPDVGQTDMAPSRSNSAGKLRTIMLIAILLGTVALLMTVCKNAIFSMGVATLVILMLNAGSGQGKKTLLRFTAAGIGLAVLLVLGLQAFLNVDVLEKLMSRLENTASMEWRLKTWAYLLGNIDFTSFWTGHGLSAAAERMFQFTLASVDEAARVLEVHNDYVQLLYDFGVPGLLPYIAVIVLAGKKLLGLRRATAATRPLDVAMIGLVVVFLIFSATDNCFAMLETPFWMTLTMLMVSRQRLAA